MPRSPDDSDTITAGLSRNDHHAQARASGQTSWIGNGSGYFFGMQLIYYSDLGLSFFFVLENKPPMRHRIPFLSQDNDGISGGGITEANETAEALSRASVKSEAFIHDGTSLDG